MTAPTLDSFRLWLGLDEDDHEDDALLQQSLDAGLAAQGRAVVYPVDDVGAPTFPADLETALYLRAQRYAARRSSPESIVGVSGTSGDFVAARVGSTDPDVLRLEGPFTRQVVS